jgi:hypothetical protein
MGFVGCGGEQRNEGGGESLKLRLGGWSKEGEGGKVDCLAWLRFVFYYSSLVRCSAGFGSQADIVKKILGMLEIGVLF